MWMLLLLLYSLEYKKVFSSSPLTKATAQRPGMQSELFPCLPSSTPRSLHCYTHQEIHHICPPPSSGANGEIENIYREHLGKNHCLLQKGHGSSVYQSRDCLSWTPVRAKLTWPEIICKKAAATNNQATSEQWRNVEHDHYSLFLSKGRVIIKLSTITSSPIMTKCTHYRILFWIKIMYLFENKAQFFLRKWQRTKCTRPNFLIKEIYCGKKKSNNYIFRGKVIIT